MRERQLQGKVTIITGASSGIGRELARRLASRGSRLVLAARGRELLEEVAEQCRAAGTEAVAVPTDVAVESQCHHLVERAVAAFGRIDILINNAGIVSRRRFDELDGLGELEQIMRVNFFGAAACTYYALPHLKKAEGRLVTISSMGGKWGVTRYSAYAASKHALSGLFDSIRSELANERVSVTMIHPSFVATGDRKARFGIMKRVMSVERCSRLIIRAMRRRRRELVMTLPGKSGVWMKLLAPGLLDRITERAMESVR